MTEARQRRSANITLNVKPANSGDAATDKTEVKRIILSALAYAAVAGAASGTGTRDFVGLHMGMTETAVRQRVGEPKDRSGSTWTYLGDGAATLGFADGKLSSVVVEPAEPMDPVGLLPGGLKGSLIDLPERGDVLRGLQAFEASSDGIRVELFQGKTSKILITQPWAASKKSMTLSAAVASSAKNAGAKEKSRTASIKKRVSR